MGKLITIYGINNIGKSTHAKLIVERLKKNGQKAYYVKYPVYDMDPTGVFLNEVLRGKDGQNISEDELQMWFVMNRYQWQPELKRLLEDDYIVVAEDYIGTGLAWGMAKGLDRKWLEEMNKYLVKEDFAIMMQGKRALGAREAVHVHERNNELVKRCVKTHDELADSYGWVRVDLQKEKTDTAELMWAEVEKF